MATSSAATAGNVAEPTSSAPVIEADESYDSSLEESGESSSATTSIGSTVFSFVYENGRRYHSDRFKAEYPLPNDEVEQDRLDLYHHMFLSLIKGKLHLAPLDTPHRILDLGTGTGIWAIDIADEQPSAEVIGTDISPIQPNWVPPNCHFQVDDIEEVWTFPKNHFDFIHMRCLSGAIKDWDLLLKSAYEHTVPGGYVEFQDYGAEIFLSTGQNIEAADSPHPIGRFFHLINRAADTSGRQLRVARTIKQRMVDAGFVDVEEHILTWPIGPWPKDPKLKEIGAYGRMGIIESVEPFGLMLFTRYLGWDGDRVKELAKEVRHSLLSKGGGKFYAQGWFIFGRKPEN